MRGVGVDPDGAVVDGAVVDGAVVDGAVVDGAVVVGTVPVGAVTDGVGAPVALARQNRAVYCHDSRWPGMGAYVPKLPRPSARRW